VIDDPGEGLGDFESEDDEPEDPALAWSQDDDDPPEEDDD
jgi:hypothetical protein